MNVDEVCLKKVTYTFGKSPTSTETQSARLMNGVCIETGEKFFLHRCARISVDVEQLVIIIIFVGVAFLPPSFALLSDHTETTVVALEVVELFFFFSLGDWDLLRVATMDDMYGTAVRCTVCDDAVVEAVPRRQVSLRVGRGVGCRRRRRCRCW